MTEAEKFLIVLHFALGAWGLSFFLPPLPKINRVLKHSPIERKETK